MNNTNFILVGHLQVLGIPLSSLYKDNQNNVYYLTVRSCEDVDVATYVMSEVTPANVVDYMEKRIGLRSIFGEGKLFEYQHTDGENLSKERMIPIRKKKAYALLKNDGLEDSFDDSLAYKSYALKRYLRNVVK